MAIFQQLDKSTKITISGLGIVLLGFLAVPFFVAGTLQPQKLSADQQAQNLARVGAVVINTDPNAKPIVAAPAPAPAAPVSTDYTPENPPALTAEQLSAAESVYNNTCTTCHGAGVLGAIKFGDGDAWKARLAQSGGFAAAVKNGLNGINAMPARGGASVSDEEFAHVVQYMIEQSGVTP
ncbi:MAG: c-type cytochrome [Cardiobacteriaceae bacterium]|nr:c-type cytochrome [Cardiobacteriaceae bacterium]